MRIKSILAGLAVTIVIAVTAWVVWKNITPESAPLPPAAIGRKQVFHPVPAPNASFLVNGKQDYLSQYRGHKIILWLYSTWCSSCAEGLHALQKKRSELARDGVTLIALDNYRNDGYSGPTVKEFTSRFAPSLEDVQGVVLGTATKDLRNIYNSKEYPDIYYLINAKGMVKVISSSPDSSMQTILHFARTGQ